MLKEEIMAGIVHIPYDKVNVMETLKEEAVRVLGEEKWREMTEDMKLPADGMEPELRNHLTRELLERFDTLVDSQTSKSIFCNVKHGLRHSDFWWAREKYLEYNDIDAFCSAMRNETLDAFARASKSGEFYHGQPVNASVLQFVKEQPHLLYGARVNNTIQAVAIPCETQKYLKETDMRMKRYYACHCPFARKSILQEEDAVSSTLCHCSLGHTKIFWEAALDEQLGGEVVSSVLGGGLLCRFVIYLPDRIMRKNPYIISS